jgi:hypothetical protein
VGIWPFVAMNAAISAINVYWLLRLNRERHDASVCREGTFDKAVADEQAPFSDPGFYEQISRSLGRRPARLTTTRLVLRAEAGRARHRAARLRCPRPPQLTGCTCRRNSRMTHQFSATVSALRPRTTRSGRAVRLARLDYPPHS